ncbi:MAG: HlyD family efflux transporter periplasmic adaptor subunit [Magnetococcales bacterium]|nr:HlyD family efflux transporter periplasmic adaptor subunit [Magnetococcales bacterium]
MPFMMMILLAIGMMGFGPDPAWGHGGEDHGAEKNATAGMVESGTGTGARGDWFEAVLTQASDSSTWIYLADAASNAAIANAMIEVETAETPAWQGKAEPTPAPGVYRIDRVFTSGTAIDVTLTVTHEKWVDLILVSIPARVAPPVVASGAAPAVSWIPEWGWIVVPAVLATLILLWRRDRKKGGVAVALVLMSGVGAGPVHGHGGEDHGAAKPENAAGSMVMTATSGRVARLPKASQFLVGLRTQPATRREVTRTIRLVGRVIPDPAFHARVHAPVPSRIGYDPAFPPPRSGQKINQGQTIAVLDPILSTGEMANRRLSLFKGEQGIASLGREMLLAPMAGRLTDVHIVPGEVVTEAVVLAEIIDPDHLWVEATLQDLSQAPFIRDGTASSRLIPGVRFPLTLTGISPRVEEENQGLHIQFSIEQPREAQPHEAIRPGMPVDVDAHTGTMTFAVAVSRQAVLDLGGMPRVWIKTAPERFEERRVRLGRKTAEWVEIVEGVAPLEHIVILGLNQLDAMR